MFIVVLGGGIDLQGNLPQHVYPRLDKAYELFQHQQKSFVLLSGKYSFLYKDAVPPKTEARAMAEYLMQKGMAESSLILDENAMDTIGNAYFLKVNIFIPQHEHNAKIITSSFHMERTTYIFRKIFGPEYRLDFVAVPEEFEPEKEREIILHQKEVLKKTEEFLQNMPDGDHSYLTDKLYTAPFFTEKRPDWVQQFVAQGR